MAASCAAVGECQPDARAADSHVLAPLLAFEADPFAFMLLISAERSRNHRHAAAHTDRRPVFLVHDASIDGPADEATNNGYQAGIAARLGLTVNHQRRDSPARERSRRCCDCRRRCSCGAAWATVCVRRLGPSWALHGDDRNGWICECGRQWRTDSNRHASAFARAGRRAQSGGRPGAFRQPSRSDTLWRRKPKGHVLDPDRREEGHGCRNLCCCISATVQGAHHCDTLLQRLKRRGY